MDCEKSRLWWTCEVLGFPTASPYIVSILCHFCTIKANEVTATTFKSCEGRDCSQDLTNLSDCNDGWSSCGMISLNFATPDLTRSSLSLILSKISSLKGFSYIFSKPRHPLPVVSWRHQYLKYLLQIPPPPPLSSAVGGKKPTPSAIGKRCFATDILAVEVE